MLDKEEPVGASSYMIVNTTSSFEKDYKLPPTNEEPVLQSHLQIDQNELTALTVNEKVQEQISKSGGFPNLNKSFDLKNATKQLQ